MELEIIPKSKVIILSILIALIIFAASTVNDVSDDTTTDDQNDRNSKTSYETPGVQNTEVVEDANTIGFLKGENGVDIADILLKLIQFLFLSIFIMLAISIGYLHVINSPELLEYVNTHLRSNGYQNTLTKVGKSVKLTNNSKLTIKGDTVYFTLPHKDDAQFYALSIREGVVKSKCKLMQLPAKLRVISLYLDDK